MIVRNRTAAAFLSAATALVPATSAIAASDSALLFASKLLADDSKGAASVVLATVALNLNQPAVDGKVQVTATEFVNLVSKCKLFRIQNTAPMSIQDSYPTELTVLWDCGASGLGARIVPAGNQVIVSEFGKVFFAPPPPPRVGK